MSTLLIEAPASTSTQKITPLAMLDAYDAVLNDDYAFVAYQETDLSTGDWRVRIKARLLTGVVFEPDAMRREARTAGAQGKPFFTWGNCIDPTAGDPRMIQYRVYNEGGKPSKIEIVLQLRNADHSASQLKTVSFPWPA